MMRQRLYLTYLEHRLAAWQSVLGVSGIFSMFPVSLTTGLWVVFSTLPTIVIALVILAAFGIGEAATLPVVMLAMLIHIGFLAPIYLHAARHFHSDYIAMSARLFGDSERAAQMLQKAKEDLADQKARYV